MLILSNQGVHARRKQPMTTRGRVKKLATVSESRRKGANKFPVYGQFSYFTDTAMRDVLRKTISPLLLNYIYNVRKHVRS